MSLRILLTNDDSHRSPLLEFIAGFLTRYGTVTIIVPQHEQSWTAKSMTPFKPLYVQEVELFGAPAKTVSGTPADCVNIALHNLLGEPPDLVVSGINAGRNIGAGFVFSSGTIGACLEANISGIPGIALSQDFSAETRTRYMVDYSIEPQILQRLITQATAILTPFFDRLTASATFRDFPVTWNVNLPYTSNGSALTECSVGAGTYTRLYTDVTGAHDSYKTFERQTISIRPDSDPQVDSALLAQGIATLSVLDHSTFGRKSLVSTELSGLANHLCGG